MAATNSTQQNPNQVQGAEQLKNRAAALFDQWKSANENKLNVTFDIAETVYFAKNGKDDLNSVTFKAMANIFREQFGCTWSESHLKKLSRIGKSRLSGNLKSDGSHMNRCPIGVGHLYYLTTLDKEVFDNLKQRNVFHPDVELKELKEDVAAHKPAPSTDEAATPLTLTIKLEAAERELYDRKFQVAQQLFKKDNNTELFKALLDYVEQNSDDFNKIVEEQRAEQKAAEKAQEDAKVEPEEEPA